MHGAFGLIAKNDPRLGPELGRFLSDAFDLKQTADYAPKRKVGPAEAAATIEAAERFLTAVEAALTGTDGAIEGVERTTP